MRPSSNTPANCRDSLTVTALADSDGASGGLGPDLLAVFEPGVHRPGLL